MRLIIVVLFIMSQSLLYAMPPNSFFGHVVHDNKELVEYCKNKTIRHRLQSTLKLNDIDFDYVISQLQLKKISKDKVTKVYYWKNNNGGYAIKRIKKGTMVWTLPNNDIVLLKDCGNVCIETCNFPTLKLLEPSVSEFNLDENFLRRSMPYIDISNNDFISRVIKPDVYTIKPNDINIKNISDWFPNIDAPIVQYDAINTKLIHIDKYKNYDFLPYLFSGAGIAYMLSDDKGEGHGGHHGVVSEPNLSVLSGVFLLFVVCIVFLKNKKMAGNKSK